MKLWPCGAGSCSVDGRQRTVEHMTTTPTLQRVVELSDSAVAKLEALLGVEEDGTVLVIEARPGGCSGLSWATFFDHEKTSKQTAVSAGSEATEEDDHRSEQA